MMTFCFVAIGLLYSFWPVGRHQKEHVCYGENIQRRAVTITSDFGCYERICTLEFNQVVTNVHSSNARSSLRRSALKVLDANVSRLSRIMLA